MSATPRPPFVPDVADDLDDFVSNISKHGTEWFNYYKRLDEYVAVSETRTAKLQDQNHQLQLQNKALQTKASHLHQKLYLSTISSIRPR
ncbi:hypothetical protein BDV33DRAFT_186021 [Aspergillus novoparasiticus]|uniref:Uncharacterized protein n=1 Tax=Aspergillus novoparasiticus TaxID=986946 RepID=A0A5N6E5L1_9EURO|nr:hypothetical protein BDV33DRAFT_186021 [Aspergillus novoparasiticus]